MINPAPRACHAIGSNAQGYYTVPLLNLGELLSQTKNGSVKTAKVVAVATEEDFLSLDPEWAELVAEKFAPQ